MELLFGIIYLFSFMDVDDQSGEDDHFSWNPCNGFSEGSCSGVAVSTIIEPRHVISNNVAF